MSTRPLCDTLQQLHVTIRSLGPIHTQFNLKRLSFCMTHLHTFTFIKPFYQQFLDEWDFLEELTSARVMPMLRRAKINATISAVDLNRFDQSPLLIDHRCVDVHFALALKNNDRSQYTDLDKRVPRGSRSHPRQLACAAFTSSCFRIDCLHSVSSCSSSFFSERLLEKRGERVNSSLIHLIFLSTKRSYPQNCSSFSFAGRRIGNSILFMVHFTMGVP